MSECSLVTKGVWGCVCGCVSSDGLNEANLKKGLSFPFLISRLSRIIHTVVKEFL